MLDCAHAACELEEDLGFRGWGHYARSGAPGGLTSTSWEGSVFPQRSPRVVAESARAHSYY